MAQDWTDTTGLGCFQWFGGYKWGDQDIGAMRSQALYRCGAHLLRNARCRLFASLHTFTFAVSLAGKVSRLDPDTGLGICDSSLGWQMLNPFCTGDAEHPQSRCVFSNLKYRPHSNACAKDVFLRSPQPIPCFLALKSCRKAA